MTEFDSKAATWDDQEYRAVRAAVVALAIRAAVPLTPEMTALEYGCGTGLLSFALQHHLGHITLADSSDGMLAVVDQKIAAAGLANMTSRRLDLLTDPLPPQKFQLVYTLMTLHHIPDTGLVLRRFYEMLDAPGTLCVADLEEEDGSFHGAGFDGHNGFNRAALAGLAEAAGFRQVRFDTVFQTPHPVDGMLKYFPVFLMTAEKPAA